MRSSRAPPAAPGLFVTVSRYSTSPWNGTSNCPRRADSLPTAVIMARWTLIISSRSATLYMLDRAITQVPGSAFIGLRGLDHVEVRQVERRSSSFFGCVDLQDRGVELRLDHLDLERVLAAVRQVQPQLAAVEERGRGRQDVPLRGDDDPGAERLGPAIAAGPEQLDQLLVGGRAPPCRTGRRPGPRGRRAGRGRGQ